MTLPRSSQLTNEGVEALWLVVPVDSQEIDGDASQHDGQADATHHGLGVEGEDEQEGPEEEVNDRPYQADLWDKLLQFLFCIFSDIQSVIVHLLRH